MGESTRRSRKNSGNSLSGAAQRGFCRKKNPWLPRSNPLQEKNRVLPGIDSPAPREQALRERKILGTPEKTDSDRRAFLCDTQNLPLRPCDIAVVQRGNAHNAVEAPAFERQLLGPADDAQAAVLAQQFYAGVKRNALGFALKNFCGNSRARADIQQKPPDRKVFRNYSRLFGLLPGVQRVVAGADFGVIAHAYRIPAKE
jgi:hypothetical protein